MDEGNEQKALAIGKSKLDHSRRIDRWAQQCTSGGDQETTKAAPGTTTEGDKIAQPEEKLRAPLLDGGQGETSSVMCALVEPRGDVNAGTRPINNKSSYVPPTGNLMQKQKGDQVNDPRHSPGPDTSGLRVPQRVNVHRSLEGLLPPVIDATGAAVIGKDIERLRLQNKRRRHALQEHQAHQSAWTTHTGETTLPASTPLPESRRGDMCPSGIAKSHPAGELLREWSRIGCPTRTGRPWSKEEMWEAVERGPHRSALSAEALQHFADETSEKVNAGQAQIVHWDDIKDNPPTQLKISPIAAIPHKSRSYRSILDLSFSLRLKNGGILPSVNDTTIKTAPKGALDQLGHALSRIIHAFAEADDTPDAKIFMAKWDVKDGFWRMMCEKGEEWNFAYVLPQPAGEPIKLVVPTSLQMGWVESPPYFCAASETARDVAMDYANTTVGSLPPHKFTHYTRGHRHGPHWGSGDGERKRGIPI